MNATFDPGALPVLPAPPAHIHFVGIGGVGVSGLARMLRARGYQISGSDLRGSELTAELQAAGIQVDLGHAPEHVTGAQLVVTTAAAPADNPELLEAARQGIPVVKRAAVLGLLANDAICLAVAGTHGKSTTSGMAAVALEHAGLDPSFAVGAMVRELGTNARLGSGAHFVVEADEYDHSFLWLRPDVAIVTSLELDHPDIFPDEAAYMAAFTEFARGIKPHGVLIVNADDPGAAQLGELVAQSGGAHVVSYGIARGDWRIQRISANLSAVVSPTGRRLRLRLAVPGRHNQLNALAVLAAAEPLGVAPGELLAGLEHFGGVGRRFDVLMDSPALTVIDDYAHHPTEVRATLAAARERYPQRRIMAIFQPHTYSRTLALAADFAAALSEADEVILTAIYASRETETLGITSAAIADHMTVLPVLAGDPDDAAALARARLRRGDVVLVMGAGDITETAALLAGGGPRA